MKEELEELLHELNQAYLKSDNINNEFCKNNNRMWGYELIQTALIENQPLILGFNWGVDNDWEDYIEGGEYQHQKEIFEQHFMEIYSGSIKRAINMVTTYFHDIDLEKGSHGNFCFFRSEKENQISQKDISLCIPIFIKLINILEPSVVFCFSSRARDYLIQSNLLKNVSESFCTVTTGKGNSFKAVKANLLDGAPIYFLPHPNYYLKREAREKAWNFCSENR